MPLLPSPRRNAAAFQPSQACHRAEDAHLPLATGRGPD
ncbi:hypothetical protein CDS [Bradyrhizobium sp.]|nr:hypothetical protein CDS [Bradyrhizobium sp.]